MANVFSGMPGGPAVPGTSMGEWLLQLFPDWAAQNNLDPPQAAANSAQPASTIPGDAMTPSVAQVNPNPAPPPQLPASTIPGDAFASQQAAPAPAPQPSAVMPSGTYFTDGAQKVSAAEEAASKTSTENALGKALSGIQAMQPQAAPYPSAPGVPATKQLDAKLMQVIQALTTPQKTNRLTLR